MYNSKELIMKLRDAHYLDDKELRYILSNRNDEDYALLSGYARSVCDDIYGKSIYIRGLIEVSNYCINDCFYCGIRRSNSKVVRYRVTHDEILESAKNAYELGVRTIVMQGGEGIYPTDNEICDIISAIKSRYPDVAITLSLGEKTEDVYQEFYKCGATRYLLRHESANEEHYGRLHPSNMSHKHRIDCVRMLKRIGFQAGCGFMVGSPYQTIDNIIEDIRLIEDIRPHMVGIGPFIPHKDTPFADYNQGSLELTLYLLSIVRLVHNTALMPATTALGTIANDGYVRGVMAGANVIMPNFTPPQYRDKYMIYEGKDTRSMASIRLKELDVLMKTYGYEIDYRRGDYRE